MEKWSISCGKISWILSNEINLFLLVLEIHANLLEYTKRIDSIMTGMMNMFLLNCIALEEEERLPSSKDFLLRDISFYRYYCWHQPSIELIRLNRLGEIFSTSLNVNKKKNRTRNWIVAVSMRWEWEEKQQKKIQIDRWNEGPTTARNRLIAR